ncbi:hypothetical protein RhiirB3_459698 [Rhizophagus irregularis]|nr:hypothetical protein RhiirB3_453778 [Rhizophagus irregularis]PKY36630.1 hypothetical protein RhiirB3_459698 [Rhizophagus irregularis]
MLYIVLHELIHSLGFTSNWQNWFLTSNKNQILITSKPDVVISDNEVIFDEFKETAFDRHLIFNSNYKNLSPVTVKLNDFANPGTKFKNVTDLIQNFLNSKQVVIAENMNNISTTFNSLLLIQNLVIRKELVFWKLLSFLFKMVRVFLILINLT